MRLVSVIFVLVMCCGLAMGQATIIGGTVGNWAPAYGVYAAPFVPLVVTPEVSLSTVSPWSAGASNASFGLVAGATNSTLSSEFVGEPQGGPYTQPVWYGPSSEPEMAPQPMFHPGEGHAMHGRGEGRGEPVFDFVSQPRESRESVATLIAGRGAARKASRTYGNGDVERQNQNNGLVKYDGKTEHI
jgi:hypothetical protein